MITDKLATLVADRAKAAGIDPAVACGLCEIETNANGKTVEADGHTPAFLFEKHVFYKELRQRRPAEKLKAAVLAGLAVPHWLGRAEYADENTSAKRLALIARARVIDEECANRSASWGIGQTMGNEAEALGFPNATAMVAFLVAGGIGAQVECFMREIKSKSLAGPMNAREFVRVAEKYNGAGEAANDYHNRLATATRKWDRKLAAIKSGAPESAPAPLSETAAAAAQTRLRDLGYVEAGKPDGVAGSRTVAATAAFQHEEGLPVTGRLDDETREALDTATPRAVTEARATVTAGDLKSSRTIAAANATSTVASTKKWFGGLLVGGGVLEKAGGLDMLQSSVDKVNQAKSLLGELRDLAGWIFGDPKMIAIGVVLVIAGIVVERHVAKIIAARVDDERTGVHAGAVEEVA